jgi:phosphatidylinositol 4-kinase
MRRPRGKTFRHKSQNSDWEKISCDDLHPLDGIIDDPPFRELWQEMEVRHIAEASCLFSYYKSFKLIPVIVKANDDLRQEILAIQLMRMLQSIFEKASLNIYLRPYDILVTSCSTGFIEFIPDTISVD